MQLKKDTLLIVEDDLDVLESLIKVLSHSFFAIVTANDGKMGLEYILKMKPTAVLTDIRMPFMNGTQMIHEIRQSGLEIPVVILTGFNDPETNLAAIKYGVFELLEKPFSTKKLASVVDEAVMYGKRLNEFALEWQSFIKNNEKFKSLPLDLQEAKRQTQKMKFFNRYKAA